MTTVTVLERLIDRYNDLMREQGKQVRIVSEHEERPKPRREGNVTYLSEERRT